jgi:hypothetical protein
MCYVFANVTLKQSGHQTQNYLPLKTFALHFGFDLFPFGIEYRPTSFY